MNPSKSFTRFAAVCCLLTVVTTLGIHLGFPDPPADFEQRVLLFKDPTYLMQRWWTIVHCLLVIISMWGVGLLLIKEAPGFVPLGFLFFAVFSITEIARQLIVLFYFNGLREQYFLATDPLVKATLKDTLSTAGLLTMPLYGLFMIAFGLGNLFYGISLFDKKGFDKLLSVLLILWAIAVFLSLGNEFWHSEAFGSFIEKYSFTYQPFMRLLLAVWLWKKAAGLPAYHTK